MKDLWKNGVIILLIIGVLYILFLRECKHPPSCPPKGQVLIAQATWDSIKALANKPPIVRIDTFWKKGPTIYVPLTQPPVPIPDSVDSTINEYKDSLVKKDIDVHYNFKVRGTLLSRNWVYSPIILRVKVDSIIYVPYIINVPTPVETAANRLYIYGTAGGNKSSFLFGGGADFITKKETEVGYMYQRFGNEGFHSVKVGARIRFKKR